MLSKGVHISGGNEHFSCENFKEIGAVCKMSFLFVPSYMYYPFNAVLINYMQSNRKCRALGGI